MNANQKQAAIIEASEADFEPIVLKAKLVVLVVFWAPWSRPCQILNATLEQVATACAGMVQVVKINADNNPDLSLWYNIQSIPTLLCFVDGNIRSRIIGTASKEAIISKLQTILPADEAKPLTLHHQA